MNVRYLYLAITLALIFMSICLLFAKQIIPPTGLEQNGSRNTDGTLAFTVRTATYNGNYAPRNSGAIWITNSSNQFVKTIKVWAATYRWTLVKWLASSGNNTVGAITGASLNSHQLHSITWNGANSAGTQVPDGEYKINIEFTEHNATTSNPGKYKFITFTKGTASVDLSPPDETYFKDMHLTWTPVAPAFGFISGTVIDNLNNPISAAVIMVGALSTTTSSQGTYQLSVLPGTYTVSCEAPNQTIQYQYNVVVTSNQTSVANFIFTPTANDEHFIIPSPISLIQNYPNPFHHETRLKYYLADNTLIFISVYNGKGQLVKSLLTAKQPQGWNEVSWDATDNNGERLSPGIYFCRLSANGITQTKALTIKP